MRARLVELANQLPDLRLAWCSWWTAPNVTAAAAGHGLKSFHAGWIEAFRFTRVAVLPEGEKTPPQVSGLLDAASEKQAYGDGVFGGPYSVDDTIMQEIFSTAVQDAVNLLRFS